MVEKSQDTQGSGLCEPDPDSFEARSVYTDRDRMVVVSGRCRCARHGMAVFLAPDSPIGGEPASTLQLRWTIGASTEIESGGSEMAPVHEIYDVPEYVTAVTIEGVGRVPIEEPPG